MAKKIGYLRRQAQALVGLLARRVDFFSFLQGVLPPFFFKEIVYLPHLKKLPLFLLIGLVIVSFIVTSMPHVFLA